METMYAFFNAAIEIATLHTGEEIHATNLITKTK